MSRKSVASAVLMVAVCGGGLLGIFAAMGACAALWGGQIIDTALSDQVSAGDHFVWRVFLCLAIPAMIVGMIGMITLVWMPFRLLFPDLALSLNTPTPRQWQCRLGIRCLRWERQLLEALIRQNSAEIDQLEQSKPKVEPIEV